MSYSALMPSERGPLRIGELSKRVGVSPELLRAWERRYGLLQPTRSSGGLRLYSGDDVERVRAMQRHLAAGLAAAEAAALAARPARLEPARAVLAHAEERAELADALERYDEPAAQAILDRLLALTTVDALVTEFLLPYLHELGDRWEAGSINVAQEHFASSVVRGRLLGLARGWGLGVGPLALLACLPGEQHDLGLIAFGLALRSRGWRIVYLGTDAPLETVAEAADSLEPQIVVLNAVAPAVVERVIDQLSALAAGHRVALGGPAAAALPAGTAIVTLAGDPVAEADMITRLAGTDRSDGRALA